MMRRLHPLFGLLLAAFCTGVHPQKQMQMRPGLWDMRSTIRGLPDLDQPMAQIQAQLAIMSPEDRKLVEDAMARAGLAAAPGGGGIIVSRACLTRQMLEQGHVPLAQKGNCYSVIRERSATGMKLAVQCSDPSATGWARIHFDGETDFAMHMAVRASQPDGELEVTVQNNARWLNADCGEVKPSFVR